MTFPPAVSGARPFIGHTLEFLRDPDRLVQRGLAEHGTMFSLRLPGKSGVILLGPEHAKFLYAESDRQNLSIRQAYPFLSHMFGHNTFWLAEHEEYLRQREILVPQFAGRRIAAHVAEMDRKVRAFIDALPPTGELELTEAVGALVLDIATSLFLGEDVARRFDGLFEEFRSFAEGMDPLIPGWAPLPHIRRSHRARDRLRAITRQLIAERRENPLPDPDFLQVLANATYADTGEPVPDPILVNLVIILVWVGHETTTGQLSWGLIDLLRHPAELEEVRAEVGEVGEVGDISVKTARRMTKLDRALHETERLHPVPTIIARCATTEIEYQGYTFPKGTVFMLHPGGSHLLPSVFHDPHAYRPDRFETEPMTALQAFGGGFHRCLGEHFAYLEMKVVVTRLLQHLDLELVDPDPRPVAGHKTSWPRSPCRLRYTRTSSAMSSNLMTSKAPSAPATTASPATAGSTTSVKES